MSATEKVRCTAQVTDRDSSWGKSYQCHNKAVVERNGRAYCRVHDPEKVKARQEAWNAKWRRDEQVRAANRALDAARDDAADLIERGNVTKAEFAAAQDAIANARKALAALTPTPETP